MSSYQGYQLKFRIPGFLLNPYDFTFVHLFLTLRLVPNDINKISVIVLPDNMSLISLD